MPSHDAFAVQFAQLALLAEPVRRDLFDFVVGHDDAVSRDLAAEAVGVPRATAKFHLDRLVDEGLLDVEFRRLSGRSGPGAGRPSKLYRRSTQEVAVSVPPRHYDLAGHLLASAIEHAASDGGDVRTALEAVAGEHGRALGEQIASRSDRDATEAERQSAVLEALAADGYLPRSDGSAITLENCPFHALAVEHTDLVCGMNLALLEAAAERAGVGLSARLEPAPGRCCVVLSQATG